MSTNTLSKKVTRLYLSGRGAIDIEAIKNNVGTSHYLIFTTDHGIGECGLRAEEVLDLGDGTITFDGITSDGRIFESAFYNGDTFVGYVDIPER